MGSNCLIATEFSLGVVRSFGTRDRGGGGCKTLGMYPTPLNYSFCNANFVPCEFHLNFKNLETTTKELRQAGKDIPYNWHLPPYPCQVLPCQNLLFERECKLGFLYKNSIF